MSKAAEEYRAAFERLKAGKPNIVSKADPINELDTVALEAGKKKGSLRKALHHKLCGEILGYAVKETELQKEIRLKEEYRKERDLKHEYWSQALGRELMLLTRIEQLEKEIARIKQAYPGIVFELNNY